jgi:hypothetical protein
MAAIAVHIGRVGQGHEKPLVPLPEGIVFPPDYKISEAAVFKAYHKAMVLQPAFNAEVFRKEDTIRSEDMYSRLQRGISNDDPRSIDSDIRKRSRSQNHRVEDKRTPCKASPAHIRQTT